MVVKILVGSEAGDHICLTVNGWSVEQPDNPVDAAWLTTDVEVAAGPFRGAYQAQLRRNDLISWRDQLAALDREFRAGEAAFVPSLGSAIKLAISVGNTGNLSASGLAVHAIDSGQEQWLEFNFPLEQSVRQLLSQVEAVVRQYPDRALRGE